MQQKKEAKELEGAQSISKDFTLFNFEGPRKPETAKWYLLQQDRAKAEGLTEGVTRERSLKGNCGGVAQLGEHLPCKQGVRSSILLISTTWANSSAWLEHTTDNREVGGSSPL